MPLRIRAQIQAVLRQELIGEVGLHGGQPQRAAPVSLWVRICRAVPSLNWSAREGRIGSAQSQPEITPGSVAHPAVKTAITLSLRQSLDFMANLSGCAQRADASLGSANGKRGLSCMPPLARGDAQGGDKDQTKGGPKRDALAKCGGEPPEKGDHGVRPV